MTKLEKLRELNAARTPGPWVEKSCKVRTPCHKSPSGYDSFEFFEVDVCTGKSKPTAEFIVELANSAAALLDLWDAVKALLDDPDGDLDAFSYGIIEQLRNAIARLEGGES